MKFIQINEYIKVEHNVTLSKSGRAAERPGHYERSANLAKLPNYLRMYVAHTARLVNIVD